MDLPFYFYWYVDALLKFPKIYISVYDIENEHRALWSGFD